VYIVVDRNIRGAPASFGRHAELHFMDGRDIRRRDLVTADALIVRTATLVDAGLLEGTAVRFVGTTSIGTDHLDIEWLNRADIAWANAPGCNANGAAQYTLAIAWLACQRLRKSLPQLRAGIVGRGNVGSRVQRLFEALGMVTVANDPPLADAGVTGLVPLEQALRCDVVCLHLPLTRSGPYPTHRMIGSEQLTQMTDGALLVNAGRGDTVVGDALLAELQTGRLHAALDVWPNEPDLDPDLLELSTVATPHVAGYSTEGRLLGTRMVYEAFCSWAGLQPEPKEPPAGPTPELDLPTEGDPLGAALEASCFVPTHDAALRASIDLGSTERRQTFDRLRREYPPRRDFPAWRLHCADLEIGRICRQLGFTVTGCE